jgi:hypothetical protein
VEDDRASQPPLQEARMLGDKIRNVMVGTLAVIVIVFALAPLA